ncbi:SpoIID/LytB domain-containing protein [Peribacillus alkalitolerans]|uniref:SpoIID/LytB domain-containing protein n=1 Tax=Peribacillus alkalitolerans TaxID=1550385 RepID=UPI0013D69F63|nr:cell wall-binding repeat-containing protein [Peribacillus alkalitolerans]
MRKNFVLSVVLTLVFLVSGVLINPGTSLAASTISVKLQNYVGNTNSINVTTKGTYKFSNENKRYSGANRFEVADEIAKTGWPTADVVVVVNSSAFADALSAAPLAYQKGAPILLTSATSMPQVMEDRLKALQPRTVYIIGGTGSISEAVEGKLKTLASEVIRIGGKDRFEVAKLVASNFPTANKAIVTNGTAFADALSIAPYAARNGYPILLTQAKTLPESTKEALVGKSETLIVGGEGSVSKEIEAQLATPARIGGKDRFEVSANIVTTLNLNAESAFLSNGTSFADALTGSVLAAKLDAPLLLTGATKLPDSISSVISSKSISNFHILGGTASVSTSLENSLPNEYVLSPGTAYSVKVESNGSISFYEGSELVKNFSDGKFSVIPSSYSTSNQILLNNKPYLGVMDFTVEGGKYVRPFNMNIPFEDYLKGVVPREMPASWELEALKAQAVAARTYSVDDIGKTVVDTISYQVYGGYQWDERSTNAVNATKGKVLKYKDASGSLKLIGAFFSSSNGGYTSTNKEEWGSAKLPYFSYAADPFDASANLSDPSNGWTIKVDKTQIDTNQLAVTMGKDPEKMLLNPGWWWTTAAEKDSVLANSVKNYLLANGYSNKEFKIIGINDFVVNSLNDAKRVANATMTVDFYLKDKTTNQFSCENGDCDGTTPLKKYTVPFDRTGVQFRSMFQGTRFKSTLITDVLRDAETFTIKGKGYGHGIGMSQNGAHNRAKAGHTYNQILEFYYPTAILSTENY